MILLTDRPTAGCRLQQVVRAVEPCALATVDEPAIPPSAHAAIICDVALDHPVAITAVRALLARHRAAPAVPLLLLSMHRGETALAQARAIGATAVLPRDVSDAQVLFTIRQLIKASRPGGGQQPASNAAVQADVLTTARAFGDLMNAARRGSPLGTAGLAAGGDAVVTAVGRHRIGAWLDVVRSYDDITYQHSLLVAGLAASFASHLGMTPKGQRFVVQAALVHDVGKANIPHAILNKPTRLSSAEMAAIRRHPMLGYEMLARQGGFNPQFLDIIRHHHEYLDGSGYPDGLRGEQVSSPVRLVTICDIYAALIERRTYKPAMASRDALAALVDMGSKLDAGMVAAFHAVVGSA